MFKITNMEGGKYFRLSGIFIEKTLQIYQLLIINDVFRHKSYNCQA